jgi:hypothetical protein
VAGAPPRTMTSLFGTQKTSPYSLSVETASIRKLDVMSVCFVCGDVNVDDAAIRDDRSFSKRDRHPGRYTRPIAQAIGCAC